MPSTEQLASPLHQELFEDAKYRQQRHDERDVLARLALQAHIKQKTAVQNSRSAELYRQRYRREVSAVLRKLLQLNPKIEGGVEDPASTILVVDNELLSPALQKLGFVDVSAELRASLLVHVLDVNDRGSFRSDLFQQFLELALDAGTTTTSTSTSNDAAGELSLVLAKQLRKSLVYATRAKSTGANFSASGGARTGPPNDGRRYANSHLRKNLQEGGSSSSTFYAVDAGGLTKGKGAAKKEKPPISARGSKHPPDTVYYLMKERARLTETRLAYLRQQRAEEELAECSFQPNKRGAPRVSSRGKESSTSASKASTGEQDLGGHNRDGVETRRGGDSRTAGAARAVEESPDLHRTPGADEDRNVQNVGDRRTQLLYERALVKQQTDLIRQQVKMREEIERDYAGCTFQPELSAWTSSQAGGQRGKGGSGSVAAGSSGVQVENEVSTAEVKGYSNFVERNRRAAAKRAEDKHREEHVPSGENYEALRKKGPQPFKLSVSNKGSSKRWEELVEFSEKPDIIVEVKLAPGKLGRIALYQDDDPLQVVEEFCKHYDLDGTRRGKLENTLRLELQRVQRLRGQCAMPARKSDRSDRSSPEDMRSEAAASSGKSPLLFKNDSSSSPVEQAAVTARKRAKSSPVDNEQKLAPSAKPPLPHPPDVHHAPESKTLLTASATMPPASRASPRPVSSRSTPRTIPTPRGALQLQLQAQSRPRSSSTQQLLTARSTASNGSAKQLASAGARPPSAGRSGASTSGRLRRATPRGGAAGGASDKDGKSSYPYYPSKRMEGESGGEKRSSSRRCSSREKVDLANPELVRAHMRLREARF